MHNCAIVNKLGQTIGITDKLNVFSGIADIGSFDIQFCPKCGEKLGKIELKKVGKVPKEIENKINSHGKDSKVTFLGVWKYE